MIIYQKDDTPIHESTSQLRSSTFQTTWIKLDNGEFQRLSNRKASRRLKISCKMLRSLVLNKEKIQKQRKGSCRSREPQQTVKKVKIEQELNQRFETAQEQGQKVSFKWILRHSRDIYSNPYPHRVMRMGNNLPRNEGQTPWQSVEGTSFRTVRPNSPILTNSPIPL